MLKSLFSLVLLLVFAQPAFAGVVYDQMSDDLNTLQNGIQDSLERIEEKEDKIISKNESENKGKNLIGYVVVSSPVRVTAFRLQGVLRLLNTSSFITGKKKSDVYSLFQDIKAVEDGIGKMDEALTVLNKAIDKGAAKKKIKELREKADRQSAYVAKVYKNIGWLDKDAAKKAANKLEFLAKLDLAGETTVINEAIKSEIASFKAKIENELLPGMRDQDFSHDSMEYNFHEFRREIRWVAIYFSSLPGLYSLTPYSLEGRTTQEQEILKKYKGNKYAEIDSENSTVLVDRYTFYLLAHYIQMAGDSKDVAEEHFKLLEAGIDSDLDEAKFKSDMVNMIQDFISSGIFDTLSDLLGT